MLLSRKQHNSLFIQLYIAAVLMDVLLEQFVLSVFAQGCIRAPPGTGGNLLVRVHVLKCYLLPQLENEPTESEGL